MLRLAEIFQEFPPKMRWIIDDIKEICASLRHWHGWLSLLFIALFVGLAYLVAGYALRTDAVLSFLRLTRGSCNTMNNSLIIAMFSGMIFFTLFAVMTLGETQHFIAAKRKGLNQQAGKALRGMLLWGGCAVAIATLALLFFRANCY